MSPDFLFHYPYKDDGFWWEKQERDNWVDQDVSGWIILKWFLEK
jgi:hypothetical protein